MLLLTIVWLFVDGSLSILVTATMLSLIVIVVTSNHIKSKFILVVATLIQFITIDLTTYMM